MKKLSLEQLGPLLKEQRGGRGIREVAKEVGISYATLSRVESGKLPDLETFAKICQWLKIDAGEMLGCTLPEIGGSEPIVENSGVSPVNKTQDLPHALAYSAHFRAEKTLSPETAQHLGTLILVVQRAMEQESTADAAAEPAS